MSPDYILPETKNFRLLPAHFVVIEVVETGSKNKHYGSYIRDFFRSTDCRFVLMQYFIA